MHWATDLVVWSGSFWLIKPCCVYPSVCARLFFFLTVFCSSRAWHNFGRYPFGNSLALAGEKVNLSEGVFLWLRRAHSRCREMCSGLVTRGFPWDALNLKRSAVVEVFVLGAVDGGLVKGSASFGLPLRDCAGCGLQTVCRFFVAWTKHVDVLGDIAHRCVPEPLWGLSCDTTETISLRGRRSRGYHPLHR